MVDRLNGIVLEIRFNRRQMLQLEKSMSASIAASKKIFPPTSVKTDAVNAFLAAPPIIDPAVIDPLETYWAALSVVNDYCTMLRQRLGPVRPNQADDLALFKNMRE